MPDESSASQTASEPQGALITGGGSGIGAAVARRLASRGVHVALLGRTRASLEAVRDGIDRAGGPSPVVVVAHHEREDEVADAVAAARDVIGKIDILFNNAGVYEPGAACDVSLESWDRLMAINFRGPLVVSRAVVPILRTQGGGIVINNSSTLGLKPIPGFAPYSVSKAALLALTRCLAIEEAPHGIRVLAICPGVVDTPIHNRCNDDAARNGTAFLENMGRLHPLGRIGKAEEVAGLVDFLVTPGASWMTGSVITIDGGISLT